jgi:hypothetical protein
MVLATIYKRAGSPYWQARIKSANGYERISTGTRDRREAQKTADEAEAELAQLLVKAADIKLMEAAARFFNEKKLKPKTVANYKQSLSNIYGRLGDFPLKTPQGCRGKNNLAKA